MAGENIMHYTLACFIFIVTCGVSIFTALRFVDDGELIGILVVVSCFAIPVGLTLGYNFPSLIGNSCLGILTVLLFVGVFLFFEKQFKVYQEQVKYKLETDRKKAQQEAEGNKQQYDLAMRRMKHDEALLKLEQDKLLGGIAK
jgi:hypothetical protein